MPRPLGDRSLPRRVAETVSYELVQLLPELLLSIENEDSTEIEVRQLTLGTVEACVTVDG